jgi:hypothetical protein
MGGCTHADWAAPPAEDRFPDPTDPAYPAKILEARTERVRSVLRCQNSLETLNRMIEFRRSAGTSSDTELQRWRADMQTELVRAEGALRRLEQKVKTDFHGEFPPWWPRDDG